MRFPGPQLAFDGEQAPETQMDLRNAFLGNGKIWPLWYRRERMNIVGG